MPCATVEVDVSSTPPGREAGVNPAQSRYGDRPNFVSPVADPRWMLNLREKGRQDRALRLTPPSTSKRGVRDSPAPPAPRPEALSRVPLPAAPPARPPSGHPACSRPAGPVPPARRLRHPPPSTPAAPASSRLRPPFPLTLTDDEGTSVEIAERARDDRLAHAGRDRDPVRARRRRPVVARRTPATTRPRPRSRCRRSTRRHREDRLARARPRHRRRHSFTPPEAIAQLRARHAGRRRVRAVGRDRP